MGLVDLVEYIAGCTRGDQFTGVTEPGAVQYKVLTMDEARRVAADIARLPHPVGAKRDE